MTVNFSSNNYSKNNVSFGKFQLDDRARNFLKANIKTDKQLQEFQGVYDSEALLERKIHLSANNSGSKLIANVGDGWKYKQGFFQSIPEFLNKVIVKADIYTAKSNLSDKIENAINKL